MTLRMPASAMLEICVMYSPASRQVVSVMLSLPAGATVVDALHASGLLTRFPCIDLATHGLSRWGLSATPETALNDRDRIEICRPLRVDPKVARRERFGRQGARQAGLFARRRPGSKPGY